MSESLAGQTSWYMALIQGGTAVPKAVGKLIETVADQIGLFLEPHHLRRQGQAEADALVSKAKAQAETSVVAAKGRLAVQAIEDRAAERVRRREQKRQANLEAIAAQAARELPKDVSEEPVDADWVAQFFNHSQDVSNEQMQTVWARILAGEVERPGSISLNSLATVRVMGKQDADKFTQFCSMVWETDSRWLAIVPRAEMTAPTPLGKLSFTDLVRLDSLGLIRFDALTGFKVVISGGPPIWLAYHGRIHTLSHKSKQDMETGCALLTQAGQELFGIAGSEPDELYRLRVVSGFRKDGWEIDEDFKVPTDDSEPSGS